MAKKWAIVIGINQYKRLQPLRYAERDAQAMRDFLVRDASFDQVYYFADRAPKIVLEGVSISTQPTGANLQRFLELRFAAPFLKQGDTLWVFFSGYGLQYANADYLLPGDAEPEAAETTAITVDALADCLSRSGTEQIVLFLDACRTEDQKFGQGFGTDAKGVVSIFSSAFGETAQDIETLQRSAFAHVLLEGLYLKCSKPGTTVAHLWQHLRDRLPQINLSYGKPSQSPRLSANAAIAPEAMPLPRITVRKSRSQPDQAALAKGIGRAAPVGAQRLGKIVQAAAASGLVLAIGLAGIAMYREVERYLSAPEKGVDQSSVVSSSATFNFKDSLYQRFPRIGRYYATTSFLEQSYREISTGNGRFCIKLVNAPTETMNYQQVIVSTLSFRGNDAYIDATQERLLIDGTFTEITDSKSIWQWSKAEVDRAGLVAACLASPTSFVREVKGGKPN